MFIFFINSYINYKNIDMKVNTITMKLTTIKAKIHLFRLLASFGVFKKFLILKQINTIQYKQIKILVIIDIIVNIP